MKRIYAYFKRLSRRIYGSIAFYPSVITAGFVVLALLLLYFEDRGIGNWMENNLRFLLVNSADTARAILTTLIGAIISLTVFSFTMVMVVLNQASNNFSPRLLPGLISARPHQVVLGIYLGVTTFCILTLISVLPDTEMERLPAFTVFVCVLLGIMCMGFFVYFINSISRRVQIDHIIAELYAQTLEQVRAARQPNDRFSDHHRSPEPHWKAVPAPVSGYVRMVDFSLLADLAHRSGGAVYLDVPKGMYALQGLPLIYFEKDPPDNAAAVLMEAVELSNYAPTGWFQAGLKQLTEVAVKAMSPGINDPGTALKALDFCTDLLAEYLKVPRRNTYTDENGNRVFYRSVSFETFLGAMMQELRLYTKHDTLLGQKLLVMLYHLLQQPNLQRPQEKAIADEILALIADLNRNVENTRDRKEISAVIAGLRDRLEGVEQEAIADFWEGSSTDA